MEPNTDEEGGSIDRYHQKQQYKTADMCAHSFLQFNEC